LTEKFGSIKIIETANNTKNIEKALTRRSIYIPETQRGNDGVNFP